MLFLLVLLLVLSAAGVAVGYTRKNEELLAISLLVLFVVLLGGAFVMFRFMMVDVTPVMPVGR